MSTEQDTVTTHDAEDDERNQDIKIYVDGNIVHRDEAKVSVYDSGFMLGDGMWEGMRLYNGKWAFFDEHMDRLFDSCKAVSLDIGMSREEIADALQHGATVLCGGQRSDLGGFFFQPTVLANVTSKMVIVHDETFGPVAPLVRFSSDDDVIAQANDTEFGLAAYLYSQNAARIWKTAEALEAGMIGINTGLISNEVAPFGGVKQSGLGREGSHYGIDEFLEVKYMCWDGLLTG